MISAHSARAVVGGVGCEPIDVQVSLHELNVPFATASVTAPISDELVAALDPTVKGRRVSLSLRQDFGSSETLATISADYAGLMLGDLAGEPENLLTNGDFEVDTSDWTPDIGTTLTRDTSVFHDGVASGRVDDADSSFGATQTAPWPIPASGGFIARGWYRHVDSVNHTVSLEIKWYDDVDALVGSGGVSEVSNVGGAWHRFEPDIVEVDPAHLTGGAVSGRFRMGVVSSMATTKRAWFDELFVSRAYGTLLGLSTRYGKPYNSYGIRPSTRFRGDLMLRSRTVDYQAGTVSFEATSDEAALGDYALVQTTAETPSGNTVRDCVNMVLQRVLASAVTTPGTGTQVVETDARPWAPGETAWSYLQSIVGSAGLRLWCDESRLWHLDDPSLRHEPGNQVFDSADAVVYADTIDREGEWADSAVVIYRWANSSGVAQERVDASGVAGTKTVTLEIERPYPGRGLAAAIVRTRAARRQTLQIDRVGDYSVRPYQAAQVSAPDGEKAGYVAGVTWSLPSDEMTVETRDIVAIGPNAWLATISGVSWNDVDAGIAWDEYVFGG